jgi:hypothetical protein
MTTKSPPIYDYHSVEEIPVIVGSAKELVLPKPGTAVIAIQIRPGITLRQEGAWWDGHVTIDETFVMGSEPSDVYPNDETNAFYVAVPDPIPVSQEPVIEAILACAPSGSFIGKPVIMLKERGVELIGLASVSGKLQTAEGVVDFNEGDAIVRSPDRHDRVWRITAETFAKKYGV